MNSHTVKIQNIFNIIFKGSNPRNEREFNDVIEDIIEDKIYNIINDIEKKNITWKLYSLWAFGNDASECCVCEDIPDHYIQCHTCDTIICNYCFENIKLCGNSFHIIIINDMKGQLGAYYCNDCYDNYKKTTVSSL